MRGSLRFRGYLLSPSGLVLFNFGLKADRFRILQLDRAPGAFIEISNRTIHKAHRLSFLDEVERAGDDRLLLTQWLNDVVADKAMLLSLNHLGSQVKPRRSNTQHAPDRPLEPYPNQPRRERENQQAPNRGRTDLLKSAQTRSRLRSVNRYAGIGSAAKALGVSIATLRRWEAAGKIVPHYTAGGHRRYDLAALRPEWFRSEDEGKRSTLAYARVSSRDQKDDLERQKQVLKLYCTRQGWTFEIIADLGSGMNYHKKGLKRLLDDILAGRVGRLVVTHKDRLLRFGAELVFSICESKGVEVVILNQGQDTTFEEDPAQDVIEIITVFSARLYGSRSHKNPRLLEGIRQAVQDSSTC